MNKKRIMALLLSAAMAAASLAGCGNGGQNETGQDMADRSEPANEEDTGTEAAESALDGLDTSEQVEIVMYVLGDEPAGQAEVNENFNKLALEKLNCTLKINWIGWADYGNKYSLLFSSGEQFDLAYGGTWLNFASLARKGAFKDLDELWSAYAPDNYAKQSETAKQQATIDGHYYCIPTLLPTYSAYGISYRTDLMDGLEWSGKIDNFDDMAEYLQLVKDNYPDMEPLGVPGGSQMDDLFLYSNGIYPISGAINDFLFIDPSQDDPQLFTYYEYDKTPEFLDMMNEWNEKGFFSKSALSDTDTNKLMEGKSAVAIHNIDIHAGLCIQQPDWKFQFHNFVSDLSNLPYTQDLLVVSNTSKNPERALALYNWITTDEEAFRAFFYGIEGESYVMHDDQIEMINTDKYASSNCWAARTKEFTLDTYGTPADIQEQKDSYDAAITEGKGAQKFRSFVPDYTNVETEYAACQNVQQQYWWPLELGYTDKVEGLKEYQAKMEAAGIDKVREELQKQLEEYLSGLK